MKQAKVLFFLIFALVLASCRPTARQTVADVVQPTDSTDAVTSENTLRMLITDKSLSQTDSLIRRILKLPLDSIVVEMMNNTDSTCVTGEAYTIEQRINGEWTVLPIKPRKDGTVYAFNDIGRYYPSSQGKTEPFMPLTILATNLPHTVPASSPFTLSRINTTSSEDRNTASSKSSSRKGRRYRKASIAIFHLSNPYPSKCN